MGTKSNMEAEKKIVEQHIVDVTGVIKNIKTSKCNIILVQDQTWEDIKRIRTKHCEAYLKVLQAQEKQFVHFQ